MSVNLYPQSVLEPDLTPDFASDIDDKCTEVYEACKGWGTDDSRLLKALGSTTPAQRALIPIRFEQMHEKNLKKLVDSETSGDFGTALELLSLSPDVAEAKMIKMACKGIGTNEDVLFPIILGRTNEEMAALKKAFFKTYDKDLGKYLDSELGGDLETLVFNALQGVEDEYDPGFHTDDKAKEDAEAIYEAGQGRWGTNEAGMFKVLCSAPAEHLKNVNLIYADVYGYSLSKAFEKELGGLSESAALFSIGMKLKPYETVAKLIKKACAGFGTNEFLLTCSIIRYQGVMTQVDAAHIELFGKSIEDRVKSEVKGKYEKLLVELLQA
jgi:hypothetical protein